MLKKIVSLVLLLTASVLAQQSEAYLIVPGERVGPVVKRETPNGLYRMLGAKYIGSGKIMVGEGEFQKATYVYPDHPDHLIKVIWETGHSDRANFANPKRMWIQGDTSVWKTSDGIGLGTKLSEVQRINGAPFKLFGFGWDVEGRVTKWNGNLSSKLKGMTVRFALPQQAYTEGNFNEIMGDKIISSDHPAFMKVDPYIQEIILDF